MYSPVYYGFVYAPLYYGTLITDFGQYVVWNIGSGYILYKVG